MQGPLAIPHQRPRKAAEGPQAAGDAPEDVLGLLAEDERPGADARVAQAGHHHQAAALLAVADRDRAARLPEVELTDLARPIEGALEGPRGRGEQRAHLAQVVVEDRLAAAIADLGDQLAHPHARKARLGPEQAVDLLLVGLELSRPGRPLVAGRLIGAQCPTHRGPREPEPPGDLADPYPRHEVHAADLGPLLHPDHVLPPALADLAWGGFAPKARRPWPAQGGSVFNRWGWVRIQPVPTTPVSSRLRGPTRTTTDSKPPFLNLVSQVRLLRGASPRAAGRACMRLDDPTPATAPAWG